MNKIFSLVLIILALALIALNATLIDFENPFVGDSLIALIGILASFCAIVLLLIYIASKKIEKKLNED